MKELRFKYLENLLPQDEEELDVKYWDKFTKESRFVKNNLYVWDGIHASTTRELYLMGVLLREGIHFEYD